MITYELALKLKESGFPQTEGGWIKRKGMDEWKPLNGCELDERSFSGDEVDNKTPNPTLSELIEAINGYIVLERVKNGYICFWKQEPFEQPVGLDAIDTFMEKSEDGETPEDAVANLYLALNKKQ